MQVKSELQGRHADVLLLCRAPYVLLLVAGMMP
jgi:hypothetical protein